MSYDLIGGAYDDFDGIAGEEDDGLAGAVEIIGGFDEDDVLAGLSDYELDAISGIDDDLAALAGYEVPTSEVTRLLNATAGYAQPRGRGRVDPRRRAAARRVARTVNGLGRQLQRERGRTARLATALNRQRPGAPAQQAPNARAIPAA